MSNERTIEDYKWTPDEEPDPEYDTNQRMVTITMPEGMWEDIEGEARYATKSGEQTYSILAMGGGEANRYAIEELLDYYRRVGVKIVQVAEGEHGTVEYERY